MSVCLLSCENKESLIIELKSLSEDFSLLIINIYSPKITRIICLHELEH